MKLSASYLQHNISIVAPLLLEMINTIFRTGRIPPTWKQCYLIPIPKKGSPAEINNYRGIAIQSCVTKILDRILTRMIYEQLGPTIEKTQHGFMKGKGTTTNLAEISQFLHDETGTSQVDIIYFDFSKAFDTIRHDLLAKKLSKLSTPYNFFRIIIKFIMKREYYLKVNDNPTNFKIIPKSSVPQGSHLGPILFVIFTNEIGINNILTYADDTKIFHVIRNMEDRNELQNNINILENWARENHLTLNARKTYHVSYGKSVIDSIYFLQGAVIEKTSQVRDLGVIFDSKLTFKPHIEQITRRLNQMTGAARRFCNNICSPITMSRIFKIYMQPIMDYASVVWNQNRIVANFEMTRVLKRITRYALNINYHTLPVNYICYEKRCEILNIDLPEQRRTLQAASFGIKLCKNETE